MEDNMKYTFQEIAHAWAEFTKPTYLIKAGEKTRFESLNNGLIPMHMDGENIQKMLIDHSQWLTFLAGESWKKESK